jgi:hypothetical protein
MLPKPNVSPKSIALRLIERLTKNADHDWTREKAKKEKIIRSGLTVQEASCSKQNGILILHFSYLSTFQTIWGTPYPKLLIAHWSISHHPEEVRSWNENTYFVINNKKRSCWIRILADSNWTWDVVCNRTGGSQSMKYVHSMKNWSLESHKYQERSEWRPYVEEKALNIWYLLM